MTNSNILPLSGLAAVNHNNNIKIYTQNYDGLLGETSTNDGTNFHRTKEPLPTPNKPRTFTPIAACSYHDGREIRVYYLTTEHYIEELCWSQGQGWYPGALNNLKVKTATYSNLAVVHYDEKFRIYYQRPSDNKILEILNDGPNWAPGSTLKEALAGTKIAADRTPDGHLRVYYQAPNYSTRQVTTRNNWGDETEIPNARTNPHSSLAIININATVVDQRLYINEKADGNNYGELSNREDTAGAHAWGGVRTLSQSDPLSNIAVVTWGNVQAIRVYTQRGNEIQELRWGEGGDWRPGNKIPTV